MSTNRGYYATIRNTVVDLHGLLGKELYGLKLASEKANCRTECMTPSVETV